VHGVTCVVMLPFVSCDFFADDLLVQPTPVRILVRTTSCDRNMEVVGAVDEDLAVINHDARSNDDGRDSNVMQDTDKPLTGNVLCSSNTITEAMSLEENPRADCPEDMGLVDTAVMQRSSAVAEADDADMQTAAGEVNGTVNDCRVSNMAQPSANGDGSVKQSDKEKNLDVISTTADRDEIAVNQAKQKLGAFHQLDHPAIVVIDLRSPPLVPLYLLHGADDAGAGGSGSSGHTGVQRRQTARRGRRWNSGTNSAARSCVEGASVSCHSSDKDLVPSVTDGSSNQVVAAGDKERCSKDENLRSELSTIIHLKVVETPVDKATSGQPEFSPVTDSAVYDSKHRLHQRDGDRSSESSDDGLMKVHNVNRTYSRNPSVPASRKKTPQLITISKSNGHPDGKKGSGVSFDSDSRTTSQRGQEFKSVPKKSKKTVKQQTRIGPAWFSRRFLNAPPPEIWKCARTSKTVETLKRPNYNAGVRHLPIVARLPTVKQVFEVPVAEEVDVATVGHEQLKLWRLSEEDVNELRSQLHQEAEHRRSEHIMPLVMQMTDAQIEHAYEHVAESMKTYEIVEADSDEEMEEDGESEEEVVDDNKNNGYLESSDWSVYEEISDRGFGETEYSRLRPKRHAVDYGPSAFAPILLMEGRRMFSQERKSCRNSHVKSADTTDSVKLQRRSYGHKSRRRGGKKSKQAEQLDEVPAETPAGKCTDDTEDTTGH